MPPENSPTSLGRGRYHLVEVIGNGGIASVWSAIDRTLGVERAIKLLDEEAGKHPTFRSRFHTEARIMARIEHPTVMRVYDYGSERGRYYLVMELIEGGSVKDLLVAGKRLLPPRALRIAFDVASALTAVHAIGAVHRDVKPGNILLSTDGSARLADFGIVRLVGTQPIHETRSDDRLGTVGYMAPEQSQDPTQVGPQADLYAIGATLFAMVTGRHPSVLAALDRRDELLKKVPEPVARVIRQATEWDLDARYADARTMAADIAHAADELASEMGTPLVGDGWMATLDAALETSIARRGRRPPGPSIPPMALNSLTPRRLPTRSQRPAPARTVPPPPRVAPRRTGPTRALPMLLAFVLGATLTAAIGIVVANLLR